MDKDTYIVVGDYKIKVVFKDKLRSISVSARYPDYVLSLPAVTEKNFISIIESRKEWIIKACKKLENGMEKANVFDIELPTEKTIFGKCYKFYPSAVKLNSFFMEKDQYVFLNNDKKGYGKAYTTFLSEVLRREAQVVFDRAMPMLNHFISGFVVKSGISGYKGKIFFPSKKVILNLFLVNSSEEEMISTIIHELCHIKYRNHQKEFKDYQKECLKEYIKKYPI